MMRTLLENCKPPVTADQILFMSIVTDGLSVNKHNLLGVVTAGTTGDPRVVLITGGNAQQVQPYTGLTQDQYGREAVGLPRALELLQPILRGKRLIVSYSTRTFLTPWLAQQFPELLGILPPTMDIMGAVKELDLPPTEPRCCADDVQTICNVMASTNVKSKDKGYSLPAVYQRFGGVPRPAVPEYLGKVLDVRHIWDNIMCL